MLFSEYSTELHMKNLKKTSKKDGMDIMIKLYLKLKERGRLDDYDKAMTDQEYRDKLIIEFFPDEVAEDEDVIFQAYNACKIKDM